MNLVWCVGGKEFSKEYLDFEAKHTRELVELHTNTKDEVLRLQILTLRRTLERLFMMDVG